MLMQLLMVVKILKNMLKILINLVFLLSLQLMIMLTDTEKEHNGNN